MITILLLIAAVLLAVWAALVSAGHVDVGDYFQLLALSLACGFASMLPWWPPRRRP